MLASVFENKEIYDDILNNWEYMSIYHLIILLEMVISLNYQY